MTTYPPATQRITRNGQTLTARVWQLLDDAFAAAGYPGRVEVSQGSYKAGHGASASGSTHDAAGAADLRVVNLPSSARANLCQAIVVELRKRGGCAWYRDEAHGGMAPHIHVVVRDESPLSSGAAQQVRDYDAGRNGLSNKGPDYHPRPAWAPYVYPPVPSLPPHPITEDSPMLVRALTGSWWLLTGGHLTSIDGNTANNARAGGIPAWEVATDEAWSNLARTYPVVK